MRMIFMCVDVQIGKFRLPVAAALVSDRLASSNFIKSSSSASGAQRNMI